MENLRKVRNARQLTLREVAAKIGIGESTLSLYESGKRQPDFATLIKLADFFHVSIDYLLERTSEKIKPIISDVNNKLRLKELRGKKSQQEIANKIGISQRAYSNYENGARQPDFETLFKLADYFVVSIDFLLGHDEKVTLPTMNEQQRLFIVRYNQLNDHGKNRIEQYLDDLLASEKYKLSTKKGIGTV